MKHFKAFLSLVIVACMTLSIVQFPMEAKAATDDNYTVIGETPQRVEDTFRYLDDFYVDQYPQAALRSRLTVSSDLAFVKSLAEMITADCSTDKEKADAIGKWVAANIEYNTAGSAYVMDALYEREGNCVSYAMIVEELLRQVGIPAVFGAGSRGGIADMSQMTTSMFEGAGHAWCFAYIDDEWVLYDVLFGEYGISDKDYMAQWYYFRNVDFVTPVYDEADMPIGFHKYSGYEQMAYYHDGIITLREVDGSLSDIGRLYVYENNYALMFSVYSSNDGLVYEKNTAQTADMVEGQVYTDGWLISGIGPYAYCNENGVQYGCAVQSYNNEKYFMNGDGAKLLISEEAYRIEGGMLTFKTGYEGTPVEVLSEEQIVQYDVTLNSTSNQPDILSVEDGVFKALKPGYAVVSYEAVQDDGGYLFGHAIECKVVDEFRQFNLSDYQKVYDDVTRIYGKNRYKTAYGIAEALKEELGIEKFESVILAYGANFPDALAGSYLASKTQAPILMTDGKPTSDDTKELYAYIEENVIKSGDSKSVDIYILGGAGAIPKAIEDAFVSKGYSVKRLSGKSRYETNLAILQEAGVDDEEILVCTGKDFADSLSASAAGLPILLVNLDSGQLTKEQKAFLGSVKNDITIIGGFGAVSESYEKALKAYDADGKVVRVKGANRYETSVAVANMLYADETPSAVVMAYAQNFPDGLCGGPLAYYIGAPLILTGPKMVNGKPTSSELQSTMAVGTYVGANDVKGGYVLGGTGALTDNSVMYAFSLGSKAEIIDQKYQ